MQYEKKFLLGNAMSRTQHIDCGYQWSGALETCSCREHAHQTHCERELPINCRSAVCNAPASLRQEYKFALTVTFIIPLEDCENFSTTSPLNLISLRFILLVCVTACKLVSKWKISKESTDFQYFVISICYFGSAWIFLTREAGRWRFGKISTMQFDVLVVYSQWSRQWSCLESKYTQLSNTQ